MSDPSRNSGTIFPTSAPASGSALARAQAGPTTPAPGASPPASGNAKPPPATETIARRAGAMVNEIDFPGFVAELVHGTFDAIVDASIRQMESYSSLVSAVAKTVDQFTEENVSLNQARDWLASRYPGEIGILLPEGDRHEPQLAPRSDDLTPGWLSDYGLAGQTLTTEMLEQQVLPQVRMHVGAERQQLLATMVMLGINRVAVRDGSISAKVMFRAAARDAAAVQYATSSDPQGVANWGERGSLAQNRQTSTMVSTVAVNAQNESNVRADLFGEVKLNFVSETLPLERLADAARIAMVQQHAPAARAAVVAPAAPAQPAAPAPANTTPPVEGGRS